MKREALKYLLDIIPAIEDIEQFMASAKGFGEYSGNSLLKAGVERKLLLIGEAVNKFRDLDPAIKIEDADKIYGLRNRLAHSYDSIDDNTVYTIVKNYLPALKIEVQQLIDKNYG